MNGAVQDSFGLGFARPSESAPVLS